MSHIQRTGKIILLATLTFSAQMHFTSCQRLKPQTNITIMGNPNNGDNVNKVRVQIAPYEQQNSESSISALSMCLDRLVLRPADTPQSPVRINFPTTQMRSVAAGGLDLGVLNVPAGTYSQIAIELSDLCGSAESLGLMNSLGSFKTAQTVILDFTGQATVDVSKGLVFAIQPIVDNLHSVAANEEVAAKAAANSGIIFANQSWSPMNAIGAPSPRLNMAAAWTGREMLVWGGQNGGTYVGTGAKYNPTTNSWTPMSLNKAPPAGYSFAQVWTGTEWLVWSGINLTIDGRRYNPDTDTWSAMSVPNAPAARHSPASVWTGTEMIVWGGTNGSRPLNTGGKYNPATDTWTPMTTTGAPPAASFYDHSVAAVWTGTEMLVWGGEGVGGYINTGGRYNPATDTWRSISTVGAPIPRKNFTPIWTGSELIIWGGYNGIPYNSGARYNPATDTWTPISMVNAPSARDTYGAVWTGSKMIVWGGNGLGPNSPILDGATYDPQTNSWSALPGNNSPTSTFGPAAVWTGSQAIFWSTTGAGVGSGALYTP